MGASEKAYLIQIKSAPVEARAIACLDMYANMVELKQTVEEEGVDALKIFNVDMEKKTKYWQEELELFKVYENYPHAKLVPEIEDILKILKDIAEGV